MTEHSAGAVVFYQGTEGREYLLLRHEEPGGRDLAPGKEYWNFPKGHIEEGEKVQRTALREIAEEAGIQVGIVPGFQVTERYAYQLGDEKRIKFVVWFAARSRTKVVTISGEHVGFVWLPYRQALKTATYPSTKRVLYRAHAFLEGRD
jgi:8-oxo-dGTP pyrophosphatase MutT (NUDIX family)